MSLPTPTPGLQDLIVEVHAVSVNPIDTKLRPTVSESDTPTIQGYDATGVVTAVGGQVTNFQPGDRVLYAGTTTRPGANQHLQAVDSRIVAPAPAGPTDAELAALPLVGLTAWELLFERMGFTPAAGANAGQTLLIINGAGGVGSIMSQLAHWSGLTVIATASPSHFEWLAQHHVDVPIDYHDNLIASVQQAGYSQVNGVAILHQTEPYIVAASKLVAPLGHVGALVTPTAPLDVTLLKPKAASLDFEYMFTKTDHQVALTTQGAILSRLVALLAAGNITSDVALSLSPITVDNLRQATAAVETGHMAGKAVVSGGFPPEN
nr:zinc-binding alcohol dehydrogenase family protein [Lacticaseibacillus thailandensis]